MLRKTVFSILCSVLGAGSSWAQASVPQCDVIKIVEPYPPGAITNIVAKMVSDRITKTTGINSYIENKAGAGGNIGSAQVANRTAPDGCTILIGTDATHASNYYLYKDTPYHPVEDFTVLGKAGVNVVVLVGHKQVPVDTLPELIKYIQESKEPVFYGSSGIGSPHHLSGELFASRIGVEMTHVPYAGGSQALTNLLGGEFPLLFATMAVAEPYIRNGQIKAFAIAGTDRFPGFPDVPTLSEVLPGIELDSWLAFFGPKGMKPADVAFYSRLIYETVNSVNNKSNLQNLGLLAADSDLPGFIEQQKQDFLSRGELIRKNNIQLE